MRTAPPPSGAACAGARDEAILSKTKEGEDALFRDLAAFGGGKTLTGTPRVKYFVDTGNLAMNFICSGRFFGGGFPGGRITEVVGPESSAKSVWGTNVVRGTQALGGIPVYLDTENTL